MCRIAQDVKTCLIWHNEGHMIYRVQILGPNFNIGYIWGEIVLLRVSNEFVDIFGMKYYFDMWIQVGSIECLMGFVFNVLQNS
jgi:hypothetical protein